MWACVRARETGPRFWDSRITCATRDNVRDRKFDWGIGPHLARGRPTPYDPGISSLAWVCLSDTHFGAENSLLSLVRDDASVDPDEPSPVLLGLISCLRQVVGLEPDASRPTLVLNGDILELALAEDNVAAMVFDRFIDLAFDPEHPLFDPVILFLPGNHDHHLWETARERMYADYVASTPRDSELAASYHATRLFVNRNEHNLEAELLSALVQRRRGEDLHVRIAYPNLGLESLDSGREVLIHHGHFTETIYRLMSKGKATLFPKQPLGNEVWDWESDNFAWIDFFWSTLGRSGSAGQDVGLIYDMLQDESALRRLVGELGNAAGDRGPRPLRPITKWLGREVAGDLVDLAKGRERRHSGEILTAEGKLGLQEYLEGPVAKQYKRETESRQPGENVSFIFGHTHKPFESTLEAVGFAGPLSIFNSGGWVVDTETTTVNQGAAVLLIDSDCNVTSLRMYNQASSPGQYKVHLSSPDQAFNGLHTRLAAGLNFNQAPWTHFSEIVAAEVSRRHELLPMIIARGLTYV